MLRLLYCLLILPLLYSGHACAQLQGCFCSPPGEEYRERLQLEDDFHFLYRFRHCKGTDLGSGTYRLQDSLLVLSFAQDTTQVTEAAVWTLKGYKANETDTVTLSVWPYVEDTGENPEGVLLEWREGNRSVLSDLMGLASLRMPRGDREVTLRISWHDGAVQLIHLKPDKDYAIGVQLPHGYYGHCKPYLIREYVIKKEQDTRIRLQAVNGALPLTACQEEDDELKQ